MMRPGGQKLGYIGGAFLALVNLHTPTVSLAAQTAAEAPESSVSLSTGQVQVQSNKSTKLQMYLPNSGALAGGKSSRVLGASLSMKKAGTLLTLSSGYHARNNKAIRGYMASHALHAPGARGSLSAHWANEADLYGDVRFEAQDALPSLELESLHELGISRTLSNGFSMGLKAKSKNDRQSVTTQLGYVQGNFKYSGVLTQNMLGGQGLSGKQQLEFALGKVKLDGGMTLRTLPNGSLETFPYAGARMTFKGIRLNAAYKRDPKLRVAGQFVESTQLNAAKAFMKGRLKLTSDTIMRAAPGTDGLLSAQLGLAYGSGQDSEIIKWQLKATGTVLTGGDHRSALGLITLGESADLRSTIGALNANMTYQLSKKTQLGLKGAATHLAGSLGSYSRVTLSSSIKHGLWDVEAMAGLNSASEDVDGINTARGGLHYRFAQKAFGQFTQQRAIFSLKVKFSY